MTKESDTPAAVRKWFQRMTPHSLSGQHIPNDLLTGSSAIRGETLFARQGAPAGFVEEVKREGQVRELGRLGGRTHARGGVFRRMIPAYAKVLPGLQGNASDVAGGEYLAIGSEKQFAAYEEYLKKAEGLAVRALAVTSGFLADGLKDRVKNAGRAYFFAFAPTG